MLSVVIPVKDGGEGFRLCLAAIADQATDEEVEVIVVDSGSTDGTQEVARSMGARVHEIPAAEFNHGETRNLGARLAGGEIVVYTVDDALPVDASWLTSLTDPIRNDPSLAATFGRHIPNEDAPPHQAFYIEQRYGTRPKTHTAESAANLPVAEVLFSNVSSAIRRDVLGEIPFAADIVISEDAEWCARALQAGHSVAYVPDAVVRHSHNYTLRDAVKRYFDLGAAAERSVLSGRENRSHGAWGEGVRYVRGEVGWMWRSGHRAQIPAAIAHEAARFAGYQLGVRHGFVPGPIRRRISRTAVYWSR